MHSTLHFTLLSTQYSKNYVELHCFSPDYREIAGLAPWRGLLTPLWAVRGELAVVAVSSLILRWSLLRTRIMMGQSPLWTGEFSLLASVRQPDINTSKLSLSLSVVLLLASCLPSLAVTEPPSGPVPHSIIAVTERGPYDDQLPCPHLLPAVKLQANLTI